MTNSKNILPFAAPLENPEREALTEAEKLEAGYRLSHVVDGTLLKFADIVHTSKWGKGHRDASISLIVGLDDRQLRIVVGSWTSQGGKVEKSVRVLDAAEGMKGQLYNYHTSPGEYALRYDKSPRSELAKRALVSLERSSIDEQLDDVYNTIRNVELERSTGQNDQPVGPGEIEKLTALLDEAEPDKFTADLVAFAYHIAGKSS